MFNSRLGRTVLQNLTAYLFIFPAALIIFVFGIFPVSFAFFVSLHDWRRFPDEYIGMENYTDSMGNLAYVLFFWMAIGLVLYSVLTVYRYWQRENNLKNMAMLLPALGNGIAIALFIDYFFKLLLQILEVPRRLPRTVERSRTLFLEEFQNSFRFPEVTSAGNDFLLVFIVAAFISVAFLWWNRHAGDVLISFSLMVALVLGGAWLFQLTYDAVEIAIADARAAEENLPIWSYVIFISAGAVLLVSAYRTWMYAVKRDDDRQFAFFGLAALLLMVGGYLLVSQIPDAITEADDDLLQGFWVTVLYVIGTVPVQLALGLLLAYLLFNLKDGKGFFRVIYFLPYITPFAATAVVFSTFFSNRDTSPINRVMGLVGIDPQKWLNEPKPINELILGIELPQLLEGPGLALVVIMIWATWTYIGYDTVIFMAGLGNISNEYYEAARIDGATGWRIFRHITLPLLSPTTFFLSLIAVIGTFQAFTQIWIMRLPAADDAVDTVGVYLFETVSTRNNLGYGSAMAFVLFGVILVITVFQNRVLGRSVFYE